jgi:hypothetical protein
MTDEQFVALVAAGVAIRWAAEDILTARTCFRSAGLIDQSDWLLEMATRLTDLAHDISPLPTEDK